MDEPAALTSSAVVEEELVAHVCLAELEGKARDGRVLLRAAVVLASAARASEEVHGTEVLVVECQLLGRVLAHLLILRLVKARPFDRSLVDLERGPCALAGVVRLVSNDFVLLGLQSFSVLSQSGESRPLLTELVPALDSQVEPLQFGDSLLPQSFSLFLHLRLLGLLLPPKLFLNEPGLVLLPALFLEGELLRQLLPLLLTLGEPLGLFDVGPVLLLLAAVVDHDRVGEGVVGQEESELLEERVRLLDLVLGRGGLQVADEITALFRELRPVVRDDQTQLLESLIPLSFSLAVGLLHLGGRGPASTSRCTLWLQRVGVVVVKSVEDPLRPYVDRDQAHLVFVLAKELEQEGVPVDVVLALLAVHVELGRSRLDEV